LAFLLSKARHDRKEHLAFGIQRVYGFLLEIDRNVLVLELPDVLEAVESVSDKSADGLGDDHVNVSGHALVNHAVELVTLFGVGTGYAIVYVNAVFDTRKIPNKQGLSAVSLRRKPSFFMLVFCFSATLPTRV